MVPRPLLIILVVMLLTGIGWAQAVPHVGSSRAERLRGPAAAAPASALTFRLGTLFVTPAAVQLSEGRPSVIELYNSGSRRLPVSLSGLSPQLEMHSDCPERLRFRQRCFLVLTPNGAVSAPDTAFLLATPEGVLAVPLQSSTVFDSATPFDLTRPRRSPKETHGRYLVKNPGLYVQIERRNWASEYWTGQLVQLWEQFDSTVNSTVAQEAALQLDKMKAMGVNTITLELRTADDFLGGRTPPNCFINSVLGVRWPQPTATELANLPKIFDLAQSKGMKIWLRLVNTHHEENPPTNSTTWLGAIFTAVKDHPALDLILFEGDAKLVISRDNGPLDTCGGEAEPPLYLGPNNVTSNYVTWAMGYAMTRGIPARKLSAEAIVGDFFVESESGAGSNATDRHLWSPIKVLKGIFDALSIAPNQRTYAISMYQHRKCSSAGQLACVDKSPHDWNDETLAFVRSVVGGNNGARIVAAEMGDLPPVDSAWPTNRSLESLVFLMNKHDVDGGTFWRWASFSNSEDADASQAKPVKVRGSAFTYTSVQREVVDMGGFHLLPIPNASFESFTQNAADIWTIAQSGGGSGTSYLLTQENGQPEVPSRGNRALRLITGPGLTDSVAATSAILPATRNVTYTTTANLRFSFTGDPNPGADPETRPDIYFQVRYLRLDGSPSAMKATDTFRLYQENNTTGFGTFPFVYTTPPDTFFVQLVYGAERKGLPSPMQLDVDNVR